MGKPFLVAMCGLQCSGKSTKAKELSTSELDYPNAVVLSSDKLREEYKNAKNDTIFRILYEKMNDLLGKGFSVIIDATNTTIKARKQIFQNLKADCYKYCYIMNTPYEVCIERLKERNKTDYPHKFNADVIKRYYYSFEIPFLEEGWDDIFIEHYPDIEDCRKYASEVLEAAEHFNQQNKHHCQYLGAHMETVGMRIQDEIESNKDTTSLVAAAFYHDIGKLFTQTFRDGDPNAHYYNHANVGAYELLCKAGVYDVFKNFEGDEIYKYNPVRTVEWLFYINYHMHLFNVNTEKSEKKWRGIFGDKKFDHLKLLNKVDKAR